MSMNFALSMLAEILYDNSRMLSAGLQLKYY